MGKQHELIADAFRNVQTELGFKESQAVRDSVGIYLAKLRDELADRLASSNRGFDRARFCKACQLAA